LVDSDIEFYKIKKLLTKNPKLLKEDPLMGVDYIKILNLIKRKKLIEDSSNEFDPANAVDSTFYDLTIIEEEKKLKLDEAYEKEKKA